MPNKYFSTTSCLPFRLQQIVEEVGYQKPRPIHEELGEGKVYFNVGLLSHVFCPF